MEPTQGFMIAIPGAVQRVPRKHRRGTNVRQRQAQVSVRLTPQEYAAVKAAADRDRRSPASVLREAFFGGGDCNDLGELRQPEPAQSRSNIGFGPRSQPE